MRAGGREGGGVCACVREREVRGEREQLDS